MRYVNKFKVWLTARTTRTTRTALTTGTNRTTLTARTMRTTRTALYVFFAVLTIIAVLVFVVVSLNGTRVKFKKIMPILDKALVVFNDSDASICRGERRISAAPYMENGITFVAVDEAADAVGAEYRIDEPSGIVTIEHNGNKAQFMPGVNVMLVNTTPIVMDSKPVTEGGHIFMPASLLSEIFNVPVFRDYSQGVVAIGALRPLAQDEFATIKKYAGLDIITEQNVAKLDGLSGQSGGDGIEDIYQTARDGKLYVTDENGLLYKWILLDDFSLKEEAQPAIACELPVNSVFYSGAGTGADYLYRADTSEIVSMTPAAQARNEIKRATMKYVNMKIASDVFGYTDDVFVNELMKIYEAAVTGKETDVYSEDGKDALIDATTVSGGVAGENTPIYGLRSTYEYGDSSDDIVNVKMALAALKPVASISVDKKFDYDLLGAVLDFQQANGLRLSGDIDRVTFEYISKLDSFDVKESHVQDANVNESEVSGSDITESDAFSVVNAGVKKQKWLELCDKAESGDILVFRKTYSNDLYGYFTHCALVMDASSETGEIRVLQARGYGMGVGADLPIDVISYDKFYKDKYWENTSVALMLKVNNITRETAAAAASSAYKRFNGYEFGYGGFWGAKETTCVEVVRDAYKPVKIDLVSNIEYFLKIKDALNDTAKSLVLLPDDIILSDKTRIVDYFEK